MKKFLISFVAFLFVVPHAYALSFPTPEGHVNDFANIIDDSSEQTLEEELRAFEQQTAHEIAVVTITALPEVTIEEYAVELFEEWGIGKAKQDNGALFLISLNDRKIRIEAGYGLEPVLTDAISIQIINNIVKPAFQSEDYTSGIIEAVEVMMNVAKGEVVDIGAVENETGETFITAIFAICIFAYSLIWMPGIAMRTMDNLKLKGFVRVLLGGAASIIGFAGAVFIGFLVFIIIGGLGFLFDLKAHKYRDMSITALPWWLKVGSHGGRHISRGGFFGGGGGGGGFGGFGGGMSGGGGASGGW
ncbi:MAG: TPM domain-containing protein [Patescibacteria group bacterium]|nr:TPM domain-containing protein [Patescibacteria group bacterium]